MEKDGFEVVKSRSEKISKVPAPVSEGKGPR